MNHDIIPDALLDVLRGVADPDLPPPGVTFEATKDRGFLALKGLTALAPAPTETLAGRAREAAERAAHAEQRLLRTAIEQVEPDPGMVRRANQLFATYGTEICGALLMAALPQAYATQWAARVLVASASLQRDFRRRITRTAQFLLVVMRGPVGSETVADLWPTDASCLEEPPAGDRRAMRPWQACLAIRRVHQAIREEVTGRPDLGDENATPLNQEDLLGTLLTFTVSVFEVLERFGIAWTTDDQQAYMHVWDLVGAHLGIGSPPARKAVADVDRPFAEKVASDQWIGLRPPSIVDTRRLLAQLRRRQWPAPRMQAGGDDCQAGRLLLRALLNDLAASLPAKSRPLALSVIRSLAQPIVRQRLNLGGGGIVLSMLDALPQRYLQVDPFTVVPVTNPVSAAVLRSMANEVTRRTMVRFLRTEDLFIPGLAEWSQDLLDPMEVGIA